MIDLFGKVYKNKRVLVTGHTGFKGSWLSIWLSALGAKVTGYSAYMPSEPCNFEVCKLNRHIKHIKGDIRDIKALQKAFNAAKPDIVFHLAAQPIVRKSYDDPKLTFDTNVGGTVNVLECIRKNKNVKAAVIITSDKCYRNKEWEWGYRENDELGGDDPYSASKGCAEIVIRSYIESYFKSKPSVASTRAGNVIGGGDWAEARIVPDSIKAWSKNKQVVVRNPNATRPWQHVLEPLSGYLCLGANLYKSGSLHGEAFNFGPDQKVNEPVKELLSKLAYYWDGNAKSVYKSSGHQKKESNLLKLSCDKALHLLKWHSVLDFDETTNMTAQWYNNFYGRKTDMWKFSLEQIEEYISKAKSQKLEWTK